MVHNFAYIFYSVFIKLNWRFFSLLAFTLSPPSKLTIWSILEMIHEVSCTLDTGVSEFTDFLTVKTIPSTTVKFFIELKNEFCMDKVSKSITYIARVVVVNRQVKEIDMETMIFTDFLK